MAQKFKNKIIAILGPTGIGKSHLALKIAHTFNLNILSTDAFMVYKQLNIGVNKPTLQDQQEVEHYYGLDLVDVNYNYSIYDFQKYARNVIEKENKPLIIVGGSMLYLDSVVYNYSLDAHFDNSNKHEELSDDELYEKLITLDALCKNTIQRQNRKRVVTALNYFLQFNKSITTNNKKRELLYDCLFIYMKPEDKWVLNNKNAKRVEQMFEMGWIDEVKAIINQFPNFLQFNASKAIGYEQIYNFIKNNEFIDKQKIINKTNQFVKHQLAWYKKHENTNNCVMIENQNDFDSIKTCINNFLNKNG